MRLHDRRHFNASALLAEGTDRRTVSGRLGHAEASTTLDIYAHFVRHADEKAAGTIGTVLDSRAPDPLPSRCSDWCSDSRRGAVARADLLTFGRRIVIARRDLEQLLGPLTDDSDHQPAA